MRPLHLSARGFRSFAELEFDYSSGAVALVGPNGAGKSTLMSAVEVALFGARSRSMEGLVRSGEDEMLLALVFEHAGETYRVRREWRRGRSSLDFEIFLWHKIEPGVYTPEPLTQGNAADTQALIEQTIGLSRETFLASGYLAQRESDSFTGAAPRDRKSILGNALALGDWNDRYARVGVDRLALQRILAEGDGRLEMLAEQVAQRPDAVAARDRLSVLLAQSGAAVTGCEAKLDEAAQAARDAEQDEASWKERKAALESAQAQVDAHSRVAIVADMARSEAANLKNDLTEIGPERDVEALSTRASELIEERTQYQNALTRREAAVQLEAEREREIDRYETEAVALRKLETELTVKAELLRKPDVDAVCDRCEQTLPNEARLRAIDSMIAEAEGYAAEAVSKLKAASLVECPEIPATPAPPDDAEAARVVAALDAAREHNQQRATLTERIAGLERTIGQVDTPEYRLETERLNNLHQACIDLLNETPSPEPGALPMLQAAALQAKAALEDAGRVHTQTTADHARAAALLQQLDQAAAQHAELTAQRAEHVQRLDILTRLEQAFGRDGVPAWIVETQALPTIETHANDALQKLGGPITHIELRTERETKAGDKREALDVICHTADGERALETFSGGEQARAEIACALGLTQLLATRRGADLRYLALDEPPGLDGQGHEALAGILKDLVQRGVECVMVASHDTALRDSFDQSVTLENRDGRSLVTQ